MGNDRGSPSRRHNKRMPQSGGCLRMNPSGPQELPIAGTLSYAVLGFGFCWQREAL